jgi:RNA processing factor Prp31
MSSIDKADDTVGMEDVMRLRNEMNLDELEKIVIHFREIAPCAEAAIVTVRKAAVLHKLRKRLHKLICAAFSQRFPDLESIVSDFEVYARIAIFMAQNSSLSSRPDLIKLLNQQQIIAIDLSLSTNIGPSLTSAAFTEACELQISASQISQSLLQAAINAVIKVAPNICSLIGPDAAAKLISCAGGIQQLSQCPACNIKVFGVKKKALLGLSSRNTANYQGIVWHSPIVSEFPTDFRDAAFRDVVNKVALVSRVDAGAQFGDGSYGARIRSELVIRLGKKMNDKTVKYVRPLPVPGLKKRESRGGRQKRVNKRKFGMGEELRARSRVMFGFRGQFDEDGEQFGATVLEGFRKRKAVVDAPYQRKMDKKLGTDS